MKNSLLVLTLGFISFAEIASAQSIQNIFVANYGNGKISEYDSNGNLINSNFITGLSKPVGLVISGDGNYLYVANQGNGTIGQYTTSGQTVNASLITGLSYPTFMAISGNNIFVANSSNALGNYYSSNGISGAIGSYTTSGGTNNANLIPSLINAYSVAVAGTNLFVLNNDSNQIATIGSYDISGNIINPTLITGLQNGRQIAISDTNMFIVLEGTNNLVCKYSTSGTIDNSFSITGLNGGKGITISPDGKELFVGSQSGSYSSHSVGYVGTYDTAGNTNQSVFISTGLSSPRGIAIQYIPDSSSVPEPSTYALFGLGAIGMLMVMRRKKTA